MCPRKNFISIEILESVCENDTNCFVLWVQLSCEYLICYPNGDGVWRGNQKDDEYNQNPPIFIYLLILYFFAHGLLVGYLNLRCWQVFKLLLNTIQKGQVPIIDGSLKLHGVVRNILWFVRYISFKVQTCLES